MPIHVSIKVAFISKGSSLCEGMIGLEITWLLHASQQYPYGIRLLHTLSLALPCMKGSMKQALLPEGAKRDVPVGYITKEW